ncbi:molybdate ABC transporter substrate-binding protein [Shewanella pneumatophori]|uniref:Molybdate ABC transporter substrate-binding protein n=1 Tax=Shewanella pneumatophori TaxID=314092 RepID=A0A9X2CGV6_9GAMM|nr:molybdate ABC transporter substrate-binding protein [Shewanella pneumatophori]MCL1139441.1 molybdate ABC transporter substrate-binding protein [Shewanella pneumatophori]
MKKWLLVSLLALPIAAQATPIELRAAGSLKNAMNDIVSAYQQETKQQVDADFGPSGLLRKRIENGEQVGVFASANMKHPQTLKAAGKGDNVVMFARNQMCALAQADVKIDSIGLLDVMLDPSIRVGTSTPKADPSGDYAWKIFAKADAVKAGAKATLEQKALQLTGGEKSAKAPKGRNTYGWVMENKRADVFLTYCTNAVLAQKEVQDLQIVQMPEPLAVGANYGLIVLDDAHDDAWKLAMFILSASGQEILADYGFDAPLKQ